MQASPHTNLQTFVYVKEDNEVSTIIIDVYFDL